MDLDVYERSIGLAPLESVARITVLLVKTIRSSTIGEKDHHLVDGLRVLTEVILKEGLISVNSHRGRESREAYPECIRVLKMGLRVPLLGVDEVGEFGGVTNEENGGVVEDPIPVTFFGSELKGKATRITSGVGRARFTTNGGETGSDTDFLANALEE